MDRPSFAPPFAAWAKDYRSAFPKYVIAFSFVALALVASMLLQRFFPYPFLLLFFAAVICGAWVGGVKPGLFAVLLSTLAIDYFFVPPLHSFAINSTDGTYFATSVLCALIASWVSSAKKRDQESLRLARDQFEARVSERTSDLQRLNAELEKSIVEREKAQQERIETQAELARLSRFLTMGELAASIAHEVNQPLTAIVTFGNACLEWLSKEEPNLAEARMAAERIVADGTRAGAVLSRIRSSFQKQPLLKDRFEMNAAILESIALIRHEAAHNQISIRTELSQGLPKVRGDRIQLQQVVLNLLMNAIDAMRESTGQPREIIVRSERDDESGIRVIVEDHGVGFTPDMMGKIFDPFFTTKAQGIGMGLSISRSIVGSHQGRLGAACRPSGGAILQFTVPADS